MTRPVQERRITWTKDNAHPLAGYRDEPRIDVGSIIRAIRRQMLIVVACASVGIAIAVFMILGSVPRYTAVETVLLDEERGELLNEVSPLPNAVRSDTAIQSEIEIIRSRALAYEVVGVLQLDQDEDFLSPPVGVTQQIMGAVSSLTDPIARLLTPAPPETSGAAPSGDAEAAPAPPFDLTLTERDRAAQILRDRLSVSRSGRSLVIEIGFTDFDPTRAAMIARGYGAAYENFQLATTNEVAAKAEDWLRERLEVLEQKSIQAAAELQEFRSANDLVQVRGNLLTEQQQSELASELMTAAADAAEAEAQLESMASLLERAQNGEEIITVPPLDGQRGGDVQTLGRDYLDASLRYRRLVAQFGEEHPQARQLNASLEQLRETIKVELEQSTEAARVSYNMARSREQSLRSDLRAITGTQDENVALRGRLQQLQAISETYAQVYRDYLARLEVTMQQQNFPIAAVKIISPATVPKGASSPQKKAMLFAGLMLGGFLGVLIGAGRELLPKPVRTASTLRQEIGVNCAGLLPRQKSRDGASAQRTRLRTVERLAQACEANLRPTGGVLVGVAPLAADLDDPFGLPNALASHLARDGAHRVLVIHESITPKLLRKTASQPNVETASLEMVLEAWTSRSEVAVPGKPVDFKSLTDELRDQYSFILLDMAPLSTADRSDPHPWAYDMTILRIAWGKVLPSFIADALMDHPRFRESLATTVLEDATLSVARRYISPGSYEELEINA